MHVQHCAVVGKNTGKVRHRKALLLGAAVWVVLGTALSFAQEPPAQQKQDPQSQPNSSQLPEVTVETTEAPKPKDAKKKKPAAAKKAVVTQPSQQPVVQQPDESASGASGTGAETAVGPVKGYVATRSATGTKTDTPILEQPRTVNVVTKDQIEAQAAVSIPQALRYVPGILLDKYTSSGVYDTYVVRGFEAPIYLDGLLLPAEATFSFARVVNDPFAFERIEVLKGPASALYGQVPPGGLINLVSKRPEFEPHNEVFFRTGSFNRAEAGIDLTGPVGADGKLAYRLVGLVRDADLQMDFTDAERYFVAPSLTWRPSRDTSLTILASASHNEGYGPQQYVPFELTQKSTAPFGRIPYSRFLGEPGNDHYEMDQYAVGYDLAHRFNSVFEFRQNLRYSYVENETLAIRTEGLDPIAADNRTVARTQNFVTGWTHNFLVDNQLQANFLTGALAHQMLFGLDYQNGNGFGEYKFGGTNPIDAYNPVYGTPQPPPSALFPFAATSSDTSQLGVYVQDQIKFDNWIATLGGRFDKAESTATDPPDRIFRLPYVHLEDDAWTYFVGLSYVFDSGIAPYASYSTSFQPASGFTLADPLGIPLKPTTGEGFEVGVKYQPPGTRTLITAAYFDITQQNVARPTADPFVVSQVGEVDVEGVELEVKASINDNLDIVGGVSHLSAKIAGDPLGASNGKTFPSVAEDTASLWTMYTWREGMLAGFGLGAGVRYTGAQWADEANITRIPGYTLADLAAKYDFSYVSPEFDGLSLQLNVANLFDKYYVSTCVTGPAYCGLGAERTIYGTLRYEW